MSNPNRYKTVKKIGEGLYKEKGSRFIGLISRCYSEVEAKQILENWRREHNQAGHLCYAYRIGLNGERYRANDDGEPSNSAGAPILGQLQSYDLTNTLAGVVRYYGGTKLGVGGLINAYRTATRQAIENTNIIELEVFQHLELNFEYSDMVPVMNCLKKWNIEMDDHVFEDTCFIACSLTLDKVDAIQGELKSFSTMKINDKGIY